MSGSPCRSLFDTASEADSSYSASTAATSVHRFSIPASIAEHEDGDDEKVPRSQRRISQFISTSTYDRPYRQQKELPQTPTMHGRPNSEWSESDQCWRLFPCPPSTLPTETPHWWQENPPQPAHSEQAVSSDVAWDDSASCVDEMIYDPSESNTKAETTQQDLVDDLRRQVQRLQLALDLQALQLPPAPAQTVSHRSTPSLEERKRMKPSLLFSTLSFGSSSTSPSSSISASSSSQSTITQRPNLDLDSVGIQDSPSAPRSYRTWVVNSTTTGSRSVDEALQYQPRLSSISTKRRSSVQYANSSPPLPTTPTAVSSANSDETLAKSESPLPSLPASKGKIAVTRLVSALKPNAGEAYEETETQITRSSWSHKHAGKMEVPKTKKLRQGPGRGRTIIKSSPTGGKVPSNS